jgi:hypothetical protein
MNEFYLLIDDLRNVPGADFVARTSPEGRKALLSFPVTHLLLDNDLGSDQVMEGIEILQWARDRGCIPDNVLIISANTVAKKRMEDVLYFDMKYIHDRNSGWWRKSNDDTNENI